MPDWSDKIFLVVEDTASNFHLISTYLQHTRVKLISVIDGYSALEEVKLNPSISLVLMDIRLPELNGLKATGLIKTIRPDLKIIAQTAYAMESDRMMCLEAGCDAFIAKPYRRSDLVQIIQSVLQ